LFKRGNTGDPPEVVKALRQEISLCSGLVICSPEYAHGIAGSMKNALDGVGDSNASRRGLLVVNDVAC
jgi:NAD(P)H-dependent FMN reductase